MPVLDFRLLSLKQNAPATIRVTFTQPPKAVDGTALNDALNPLNYTISGISENRVTNCGSVYGDPNSIDLFLAAIPDVGIWSLVVSSTLIDTSGDLIESPFIHNFTVVQLESPINPGAVNDAAENVLRKFLNPYLKGPGWDAMIAAVATGEQLNWDNAKKAFDQLFVTSASGLYLDRLAADNGIEKPVNLGMSDELFREYVIKLTNGKLTEESLLELLEIFYGQESVRAHDVTGLFEPFTLNDGDDLRILFDERVAVRVSFSNDDFADTSQAKAIEVAVAITNACRIVNLAAFALPSIDPTDGHTYVKIYSPSLGLASSVRVTGGKAQNALQFLTKIVGIYDTFVHGLGWDVHYNAATNRTRYTANFTGLHDTPDLSLLQIGDYVNIFGSEFNPSNRGSFPVVDVWYGYTGGVTLVEWFEVENVGTDESVHQSALDSILYFRPTRKTTHTTPEREVVVAQPTGTEIDIVLPATSSAVNRENGTAAYAQLRNSLTVSTDSIRRADGLLSIHTLTAHGLTTGDWVQLDGVNAQIATPPVNAGSIANPGTSSFSAATVCDEIFTSPNISGRGILQLLPDGRVLAAGGIDGAGANTSHGELLTITSVTVDSNLATQAAYSYAAAGALPTTKWKDCASAVGEVDAVMNGLVIASGGEDGALVSQTAAVVYHPGTNVFSTITSMNVARFAHAMTVLADGRVLVTGGITTSPTAISSVEMLTSGPYAWTNKASMHIARFAHKAIRLQDGRVLVIGGSISAAPLVLSACEIYDPAGNTWTQTGRMDFARTFNCAILLPNGEVFVACGQGFEETNPDFGDLSSAEIYNPTTGRWRPAGSAHFARDWCYAVYLPDRNSIMVGGGSTFKEIEYYNLDTGKWTISPAATTVFRAYRSGAFLTKGVVVISGTNETNTPDGKTQLFIPGADTFVEGGANGQFQVTVTGSNTFTVNTPGYGWSDFLAGGTVTPVKAAQTAIVGPYAFNPSSGVAVTAESATLATLLAAGHKYDHIDVDDATAFPDEEGWLVFAFGFQNQVAPVRYFGRISDTELSIDSSFKFPATINAGDAVTLLYAKGAFIPPAAIPGAFYLTDSPAGRIAAEAAIDDSTAAGVTVNKTITYPGDRGLGGEGYPTHGNYKVSDAVRVWAGETPDAEAEQAEED